MSKVCALCGKRPVAGNNVSHSKRRTRRRFLPNLVSKKFAGVKIQICTRCLRTLQKPVRIKNKGLKNKNTGLRTKDTVDEPEAKIEKVAEPKTVKKSSAKK